MEMLNKLKRRFDRIKRNIPRFVLPVVICITLASFIQLSRDITLDQANILADAVMLAAAWMAVAWVLCRKKPTLTKYYVCLCGFFLFTAIFCVLYARTPNAPEHMLRANQKLILTSIGGASAYAAVICIKLCQNRKLNKTRKSKKK